MARIILSLSMIVAVIGCAVPGSSAGPGTDGATAGSAAPSASAADPPVGWDRAGEPQGFDLCAEDAAAEALPAFGEPDKSDDGVVRHSVVSNSQGELFRVDVTGVDDGPVVAYLEKAMLCLDVIFTDAGDVEGEPGVTEEEAEPPDAAFAGEDLIIEITILGFVDANAADPAAVAKDIGSQPLDVWPARRERNNVRSSVAPDDIGKDYLIDAVIDPPLGKTTHHYRELYVKAVQATISVDRGQVTAALCRGSSYPFATATVNTNGSARMSGQTTLAYLYDLAVKGLTSDNRYKVAKSWWIPGWVADFGSSAPIGSTRNCYP
jgi:hypothetical protein